MRNTSLSKLIPNPPSDAETRSGAEGSPPSRRLFRERIASWFPALLALAFLALIALVFGERLLPATHVTVASVVTLRTDADQSAPSGGPAGQPLFQASGWVEPAPFPHKVPALVEGVIDQVHVLEGESVEAGQLLAELVDEDFRLDLATAQSRLASLEAQAAAHHQMIVGVKSEMETLDQEIVAAEARLEELRDPARRLAALSDGNVSDAEVAQARLKVRTQAAEVAARIASREELLATRRQREELMHDYEARIAEARTDVERKALALERTRIKAPFAGRILHLDAVPGQKKRLGIDNPDSATIAILYQPAELQARVDLPLARAAEIEVGQPAKVRTELLPDRTFEGEVVRIAGQADLQRNTLQVKVRLTETDPRLRPEMLCRAEFFGKSAAAGEVPAGRHSPARTFVPGEALVQGAGKTFVWCVGPDRDRLEQREVRIGEGKRENFLPVIDGLRPGDRVVLDPADDLRVGMRVTPMEGAGDL